jgi:hypothetical protein
MSMEKQAETRIDPEVSPRNIVFSHIDGNIADSILNSPTRLACLGIPKLTKIASSAASIVALVNVAS